MRDPGIAPLGKDRLVVLDHPQPRDLTRHHVFEMAQSQDFALTEEMVALDDALPQDSPHAIHNGLGTRADGGDRLDLPRFFSLARELRQIVAAAAVNRPAALLHPFCDPVVEVKWKIADERDDFAGP